MAQQENTPEQVVRNKVTAANSALQMIIQGEEPPLDLTKTALEGITQLIEESKEWENPKT